MTNTTIDYYYNAGWQVVEERVDGDVHTQYLWCPSYIDTPVLRWRDTSEVPNQTLNETLYYTVDANKNVTALVEPGTSTVDGTVVERYLYDPYGRVTVLDNDWNEIAWSASRKNEILFAGYRYNPETGYYQVRHREFNPLIGRWMQRDPLGYVDGGNLYAGYFVMWGGVDPMGLAIITPEYWAEVQESPPSIPLPGPLPPSPSIWSPVPSYPPTVPMAPRPTFDVMSNSLIYPGLAGDEISGLLWSETADSLHDLALSQIEIAPTALHAGFGLSQSCECLSKLYGVELDLSTVRGSWVLNIPPTAQISWSEVLDVIQTGLDVGGLVPAAGIFCDIPNAGIYLARGDFLNAGLSSLAAIPFWGAPINAARLGARGVDVAASGARGVAPGRSGAFRRAKRDAGIPTSQQPDSVSRVPMTDRNGKAVLGPDGKPIMTREHTFTRPDGSKVVIQDHSAGHSFRGVGDQGPHFNVRPPENTRTGNVPGTQPHYPFDR